MEGGSVGHNLERDPPNDYPCQAWFNLVHEFRTYDGWTDGQTDGRRQTPSDGKGSHCLWPGGLKRLFLRWHLNTIIYRTEAKIVVNVVTAND